MKVCLVLLCLALLRPEGSVRPASAGCSSPEALRMAEEALEQLNQYLSDGYNLSLNRLYDISHTPERGGAFLYKLSLDVIETKCHISSRKPWKQCEVRSIGVVPVYGECEGSIHGDPEVKFLRYTCALREGHGSRGSSPCKSRKQGRGVVPIFSYAHRRPRRLMCSEPPWNDREPASS